jgi:hypothetical protein
MTDQQSRVIPVVMRFVLVASVVGVVALWLASQSPQTSNDVRYIGATGHNIRSAFLAFYDRNGGLEIFGYPITEQFTHENTTIQYFQNVLMELEPDGGVGLSPIALEMDNDQPPIAPPEQADLLQRYFSETGHLVDERFYNYFRTHGGVAVFGYPITEAIIEANQVVQYFQNAKMEWHPELQAQPVSMSALGEAHFYSAGMDINLLRGVPARIDTDAQTPTDTVMRLDVDASLAQTHTTYPGTQTVTAFVTRLNTLVDGQPQPVEGARVHVLIQYPDPLPSQEFEMQPTDAQGRTSLTFDLPDSPISEKVVVFVTGEDGGETDQAQRSFIRWP